MVQDILDETPRLVQNMAYGPVAFARAVVGVWIALDKAALDNGYIHVISGYQADGATPRYAMYFMDI